MDQMDLIWRLKIHGQPNAQIPDDTGTTQMRKACRDAVVELNRLRELLRIAMDSRAPDMIVAAGYTYWPESVLQAIYVE
jgi:hypothetical protein